MSQTTLHYGSVGFALAADVAVEELAAEIAAAVQRGGDFVTLHALDGTTLRVLFTAGVPVWFAAEGQGPEQGIPRRIR